MLCGSLVPHERAGLRRSSLEAEVDADTSPTVAVGMGSNLGDRVAHLRFGLARLARVLDGIRVSPVYETEPVGYDAQPPFLNACCVGQTRLTARQLLSELQDAERAAGRVRKGERYGPRVLDLDLLVYGDVVSAHDRLTLPHPRLRERAFVLVPLVEVAPDLVVPGSDGAPDAMVAELVAAVNQSGVRITPWCLDQGGSGGEPNHSQRTDSE